MNSESRIMPHESCGAASGKVPEGSGQGRRREGSGQVPAVPEGSAQCSRKVPLKVPGRGGAGTGQVPGRFRKVPEGSGKGRRRYWAGCGNVPEVPGRGGAG